MKKMPKLSVIVVNWNGEIWLKRCLESLYSQAYPIFEIIVVDNASTDSSIEIIKCFGSKVKLTINESNLGFATGVNKGVNSAKGELVFVVNTDTWFEPNMISGLVKEFKAKRFDIISPRETTYEKSNIKRNIQNITTIDFWGHPVSYEKSKKRETKDFFLIGVALLFKRSFYLKTKGLDPNFFMYVEEVDWFWRVRLFGYTYGYADNIYIHHAGAGGNKNQIRTNTFLWRNQNTLVMLLKNYSIITLVFILPLYFLQNIMEILFFLFVGKPQISLTYLLGWLHAMRQHNHIRESRWFIQNHRKISDFIIMKDMYLGLGKYRHYISRMM